MNRKYKTFLAMLVLTALSCNVSNSVIPSENSEELPSTENNTECDANKWTFGPAAVYRYPQKNGVDLTIVDWAIHNGSDKYWGYAGLNDISVTTEDGYTYLPFNGVYENIPASPKSPYSYETYNQYGGVSRIDTTIIPPGFTVLGTLTSDVSSGRYTLGFEVASSQKSLTMHIRRIGIICFESNHESETASLQDISYSLDDLSSYPMPASDNYPELGSQPIVVPGIGTFVYQGKTGHTALGWYTLQFSFTNASGGYSTEGRMLAFIIGDDGLIRDIDVESAGAFGRGRYDAGPGQTVDVNPLPFKFPSNVSNLKFLFIDRENNVAEAFNLSP